MFPASIQKLIELFAKFPTVGPKTARRFVFYLIKQPKEKIDELITSIQDIKNKIIYCSFCFNPFDPSTLRQDSGQVSSGQDNRLCEICKSTNRDKSLLCIIEKETDLETIEKTKKYNGLYYILGGAIETLKKDEINGLRLKELKEHLKNPQNFGIVTEFKEIIIATNPTPEGRATALFVEKIIKEDSKATTKITHLGLGLPVGGELEYADEETLENAFNNRS